jgi:hypothetical protein
MIASIAGLPRVQPVLELGIGDSRTQDIAALWDVDQWDNASAQWSGVEPFWIDTTCYGHQIETFTGHERASEVWEVGRATILLDNRNGWADYPPTTQGYYDYPLRVRPGVSVRVGVLVDGVYHGLWRGFIDASNPGYHPELGETVQLECIDAKGESGRGDVAKVEPAVGASEYVHQRIGRVLDLQYWPPEWRALEAAGIRLVATELGQPAIDAINRASDSGGGSVFGDINGKVCYRNYGWLDWSPDEPPDGSIGNVQGPIYDIAEVALVEEPPGSGLYVFPPGTVEDPAGSGLYAVPGQDEDPEGSGLYRVVAYQQTVPGDICPVDWELSFARADFSNRVIVGRSDMTQPLVYDDVPDRAAFGVEPFTITDLQTELTGEMTALAQRILRARNFALAPRIIAVTLDAATADNAVDLMAKVDPRNPSRVLCRHRADDGRIIFNKQCIVTGIRHLLTPTSWQARLTLDDASPWAIGVKEAEWDVDQWDQDQWAKVPEPI